MLFGGDGTHTHTPWYTQWYLIECFCAQILSFFRLFKKPRAVPFVRVQIKYPISRLTTVIHSNEEFFSASFICSSLNELNQRSIGFFFSIVECAVKVIPHSFFPRYHWDLLHFYLIRPSPFFRSMLKLEEPFFLLMYESDSESESEIKLCNELLKLIYNHSICTYRVLNVRKREWYREKTHAHTNKHTLE